MVNEIFLKQFDATKNNKMYIAAPLTKINMCICNTFSCNPHSFVGWVILTVTQKHIMRDEHQKGAQE